MYTYIFGLFVYLYRDIIYCNMTWQVQNRSSKPTLRLVMAAACVSGQELMRRFDEDDRVQSTTELALEPLEASSASPASPILPEQTPVPGSGAKNRESLRCIRCCS